MRFKSIPLYTTLLLLLTGCAYSLHQYHVGDLEPFNRKSDYKRISVYSEQFVVMGLVTDTRYINRAFLKLQEKCPRGKVTGIHTRYSTGHGFFSWTNKVKMTGTCVQ